MKQETDTIALLKECNAGCKMATSSLEQVIPKVQDENLKQMLEQFDRMHIDLGDSFHVLLNQYDKEEKDPHMMASMFSTASTDIKLMVDPTDKKIAKIIVEGCDMGVNSVHEYLNQYFSANEESKQLANDLIELEEKLKDKLVSYL